MSSQANPEQKLAIEHNGGVLLQAGAGSGKTFVLIEHITYILNNCLFDSSGNLKTSDGELIRENLKKELSRIVLMTFTKKAAGELSIRLSKKINQAEKDYSSEGLNPWSVVKESIDYLTVSTIDGFCFKLLKEGYFSDFTPNLSIIMDSEFRNKIQLIFNEWLEEHTDHLDKDILELLVFHRDGVLSSLYKIFSNPELRILWKDLDENEYEEFSLDKTLHKTFNFEGLLQLIENVPYHGEYHEYSDKPWCKFLENFDAIASEEITLPEKVKKLDAYLKTFKRTPTQPQKKLGLVEVNEFFEGIKKFKKFITSSWEYYLAYEENYDSIVLPWMKAIKDLVGFIDHNYMTIPGITFADLEYYVLLGVRDPGISARILANYNYFIIDEFQDTSFVQFEIIEKIIAEDYSKIFCVGDIKQAIYGFKGGEIKVFQKCAQMVPKILQLSNNYRSNPNIINMNNDLFDFTFNLGLGFKGKDFDPVEVVYQKVPEGVNHSSSGELYRLDTQLKFEGDDALKLKSWDINKVEAQRIFDDLKVKIDKEAYHQYAVLYKNLGPSLHLIRLMIENHQGFSAQIKIPFSEDPIIGMFRTLLEFMYDRNAKNNLKHGKDELEFVEFMISSYLDILCVKTNKLRDKIESFYKSVRSFGLYNSFEVLLFNIGIANSNQSNNLSKIKSICELSESYDQIIGLLESSSEDKYSLEFQAGKNAKKVIMMTAHASKGLEFEHVYLAGIYTNGRDFPNTDTIGKLPGSFKWHPHVKTRESYKTPMYIFENIFEKHKTFSESKRLFYVACSRAEKALSWVSLNFENTKYTINGNSWIKGIEAWEIAEQERSKDLFKAIDEFKSIEEVIFSESSDDDEEQVAKPLFHQDSVGLSFKNKTNNSLLVLPELSVTRASMLTQCPRKFYLRNVCKIEEDDLNFFDVEFVNSDLDKPSEYIEEGEFVSSANRGTTLHSAMEYAVKHNFVLPQSETLGPELTKKDITGLNWCINELKQEGYQQMISEKLVKFSLFGHMITGTPDLVLLDHSQNKFAIWDYKSGRRKPDTELGYWFQLYCYAYSLYELNQVNTNQDIELALMYLDEQNKVNKSVSYTEVVSFLKSYWLKSFNPDEVNRDHCSKCSFSNICQL